MIKTIIILCSITSIDFEFRIYPDRIELYQLNQFDFQLTTYRTKILDLQNQKIIQLQDHEKYTQDEFISDNNSWNSQVKTNDKNIKTEGSKFQVIRSKANIITDNVEVKYLSFFKPFYDNLDLINPFIFEKKISGISTPLLKITEIKEVQATKDIMNNDDLKFLCGVDGYISELLNNNNIYNFSDLVSWDLKKTDQFLVENNSITMKTVQSWQQEAELVLASNEVKLQTYRAEYLKNFN